MRIGIVTTTINNPIVLDLYRRQQHGDFQIYVAGDLKTPALPLDGAYVYLTPGRQERWQCSEHIGWNTDSRRNIAVLEALADGAEIIFSIDDDMIPLHTSVLEKLDDLFSRPFSGIQVGEREEWMDHGRMTVPLATARGIPYDQSINNTIGFVTDVQIGVVQGIIYGVPDATAVDAIANRPLVTSVVEPLASGFVAHPEALMVFNSQFTAFRRELAPWFVQHYKSEGRNTDIFAAITMHNAMRDFGWYTYYGPPGAWHNRMTRPLFNDLKAEMYGAEHIDRTRVKAEMYGAEHIDRTRALPNEFLSAWMADIKEAMWIGS